MRLSRQTLGIGILSLILLLVVITVIIQIKKSQEINEADLVKPLQITADRSLDKITLVKMVFAARLFYSFWDTGEYKYLNAAAAPDFTVHNGPKVDSDGAAQLKQISNELRAAIPDLRCTVEELLISGDKVTARLLFTGTSKGRFMQHAPTDKPIKFMAMDILKIQNGKLVDNWHIEDSLSLLEQLNIISPKQV